LTLTLSKTDGSGSISTEAGDYSVAFVMLLSILGSSLEQWQRLSFFKYSFSRTNSESLLSRPVMYFLRLPRDLWADSRFFSFKSRNFSSSERDCVNFDLFSSLRAWLAVLSWWFVHVKSDDLTIRIKKQR
jgi:hypothetical protein